MNSSKSSTGTKRSSSLVEGCTRSKVAALKKGYLRIAYAANVPVFIVALHGPTKEVILDKVWPLTFDTETDNRKIKAYYDKNYIGIRPELG